MEKEINLNLTNSENEFSYKPIWLTIIASMHIFFGYVLLTKGINLNYDFGNGLITELGYIAIAITLLMNILFWFYCFVSVLTKDFKKDVNKIVWFFALIFTPFIYVLYLDLEKNFTK